LVHVTLNQRDEQTVLIIEDDARPIPEMEANVLRGDHEMTAVYHSTGLGLWLVYWIVELSEGWLTVESSAEGNRIRITIPDTRSPER
jgi:signal transduction histidine kinase